MIYYFCFIKFGKKEHLEKFQEKGQIRFGSINSFSLSNELERGDKFEGASNIINDQITKIEVDHPTLGKHSFSPLTNNLSTLIQYNCENYFSFSTYSITTDCFIDSDIHRINHKLKDFGEYALVINEPIILLEKIKFKLRELNIEYSSGLIKYLPIENKGEFNIDLFTKTANLQHQQEYRILINTKQKSDTFFIEIGSIKEISFISKTSNLIETKFKARVK